MGGVYVTYVVEGDKGQRHVVTLVRSLKLKAEMFQSKASQSREQEQCTVLLLEQNQEDRKSFLRFSSSTDGGWCSQNRTSCDKSDNQEDLI